MKTVARLNQEDIIQILADHFNVDRNSVHFSISKEYDGIGPMEHEVHRAKVEIDIDTKYII